MSDLSYSIDQLSSLGSDLSRLAGDLSADARTLGQFTLAQVGHRDVIAALADFADDWHDRRESLVLRIGDLGTMATASAHALSDTDTLVARDIRNVLDGAA